jgi:hypothetical protein
VGGNEVQPDSLCEWGLRVVGGSPAGGGMVSRAAARNGASA